MEPRVPSGAGASTAWPRPCSCRATWMGGDEHRPRDPPPRPREPGEESSEPGAVGARTDPGAVRRLLRRGAVARLGGERRHRRRRGLHRRTRPPGRLRGLTGRARVANRPRPGRCRGDRIGCRVRPRGARSERQRPPPGGQLRAGHRDGAQRGARHPAERPCGRGVPADRRRGPHRGPDARVDLAPD